jgi:hypothetical protein
VIRTSARFGGLLPPRNLDPPYCSASWCQGKRRLTSWRSGMDGSLGTLGLPGPRPHRSPQGLRHGYSVHTIDRLRGATQHAAEVGGPCHARGDADLRQRARGLNAHRRPRLCKPWSSPRTAMLSQRQKRQAMSVIWRRQYPAPLAGAKKEATTRGRGLKGGYIVPACGNGTT